MRVSHGVATGGGILKIYPYTQWPPPFKSEVTLVGGEAQWKTLRRDNGMGGRLSCIMVNFAIKNDKNISFKTLPHTGNFKLEFFYVRLT